MPDNPNRLEPGEIPPGQRPRQYAPVTPAILRMMQEEPCPWKTAREVAEYRRRLGRRTWSLPENVEKEDQAMCDEWNAAYEAAGPLRAQWAKEAEEKKERQRVVLERARAEKDRREAEREAANEPPVVDLLNLLDDSEEEPSVYPSV